MTYDKLDNDELLRIALDALNQDLHAEAVSMLKTLVERDSNHVFGTYLLAAEHMQLGMVDRAEAGFRRTVELAPDFPMARFQLGQLYLVKGDAESARAVLAPVAALPENMALGHYAKGLIAAANEDADHAIAELQAGLACEQDVPAMTADMQRVLDNLRALQGGGQPAPTMPTGNAAPLYLSNYGKPVG
ncbi:tetratricopeptide repeat protein [Arenimonas sp.]|uniref:tetratricopeptide repeat protein n=1 Tax=Arenimonas sp. TaxID=1872635 RepID=UPI0039E39C46